jgi:hypothetical protein
MPQIHLDAEGICRSEAMDLELWRLRRRGEARFRGQAVGGRSRKPWLLEYGAMGNALLLYAVSGAAVHGLPVPCAYNTM